MGEGGGREGIGLHRFSYGRHLISLCCEEMNRVISTGGGKLMLISFCLLRLMLIF